MRATRHPTSLQIFHTRTAPFPAMDNCFHVKTSNRPSKPCHRFSLNLGSCTGASTVFGAVTGRTSHDHMHFSFKMAPRSLFVVVEGPKGRLPCSFLARCLAETKKCAASSSPPMFCNDSFEERDDRQVARHFHHLCLQQSGHLTDRPGSGAIRTCQ